MQYSEPYLSTVSQPELEKIGLKAVAAGAEPQKLQEAYFIAQANGDWTKLETLISRVLGEDSVKHPTVNRPSYGVTNFVSNLLGKFIIT